MEEQLTRLNKFLSEAGFCSRREADKLIEEGRVTINGKIPEMGTKVAPTDEVCVDGKSIAANLDAPIYIAFNKPIGIECTTNQEVRNNIVDYINYPIRIFPVGRLDKDSEGLIIMTNDGDIVNKILRARNNHEKEYIVTVDKPITDRFITRMGNGVPILDTITKKCRVEKISRTVFRIFLTQGLNRQIRRMTEYLGYKVVALKRVKIINISLDVPIGKYREITSEEMNELNRLIGDSSKTEEASLPKTLPRANRATPPPTRDKASNRRRAENREERPIRNERKSNERKSNERKSNEENERPLRNERRNLKK